MISVGLSLLLAPGMFSPMALSAQPAENETQSEVDQHDDEPLESGRFQRLVNRAAKGDGAGLFELYNFQPVLGGLRSGAGTTVGIQYAPLDAGNPEYVAMSARMSRRGYWGVEGLYGRESDPITVYGFARYRHMPQEDYYGIGPNTLASQHATFRLDELFVGGLVGAHLARVLFFGGHLGFLENRVGAGGDEDLPSVDEAFIESDAPGMHPGVSYLVSGVWAEYNTRDLPPLRGYGSRFSPAQWRLQGLSLDARHGLHASIEVRHYTDLDGGDYGFARLNAESQQFLPAFDQRVVLALREFGSFSLPERDDVVPFYMMQSLGGVRSVRGFDNFRFRELNVALINAEVRWYAWKGLQLAVFGDAGHVFRRFESISPEDLELSLGLGARLQMRGRTFIRLEAASSREGVTTYVNVGSFL